MKQTQEDFLQTAGYSQKDETSEEDVVFSKLQGGTKSTAVGMLVQILYEHQEEFKDYHATSSNGTVVYYTEACDILFHLLGGRREPVLNQTYQA